MPVSAALCRPPSAPIAAAQAWARQNNALRLPEVDAYLREIWRLGGELGYDPAVVAAQSSAETAGWTTPEWRDRLNPAAIGIGEATDAGVAYPNGTLAARAHLVHLSAFERGYDAKLQPFITLDPAWQTVFERGHAAQVKNLSDLGGRWSDDPRYDQRIGAHLEGIRGAIQGPSERPPHIPGGAPPPKQIQLSSTGNWNERTFDQRPQAIVYHLSGDADPNRVLAWLQNPISRASVHALITLNGDVHLLVEAERSAWSNNDIKNPRRDIPWLNDALAKTWLHGGPMSLNDFTLAIELVGTRDADPSDAQYRATIALSAYWRDRFGFVPCRGRMLRHSDINSVDRLYCPGPRFDLARVIEALGGSPDDLTS